MVEKYMQNQSNFAYSNTNIKKLYISSGLKGLPEGFIIVFKLASITLLTLSIPYFNMLYYPMIYLQTLLDFS